MADINSMVSQGGNGGKKRSSIARASTCHLPNIKNPKAAAERLKLSFQRVDANLTLAKSGRVVDSSLVLLDISESGIGIFINKNLSIGTSVMLNITTPVELTLRGMVAWCAPIDSRMDTTKLRHTYRAGIKFSELTEAEGKSLSEFISAIKQLLLNSENSGSIVSPAEPSVAAGIMGLEDPNAPKVKLAERVTAEDKADAMLGAIQTASVAADEKSAPVEPVAELKPTEEPKPAESDKKAA